MRSGLARNPALPASLVEQPTALGDASVWLELTDRDDLSGDQIAAPEAMHYLRPVLVHRAGRRPEFSPHWRCMLLLTMRDGQEVFSLLDVWPASFGHLPETLDSATKHAIAYRLDYGGLPTSAQWASLDT
ncbi:hypothetical protein [Micromonospora musae]|uniref:hypothetical protein n=1 Tax=Micromonospora musae TaxID=1894970 RepID=UPI00341EB1DF